MASVRVHIYHADGTENLVQEESAVTEPISIAAASGLLVEPNLPTDDIVAIHQLLALYGHAADLPEANLVGDVFTEDAVFESGRTKRRFVGLAQIKSWFAEGKPPHPPAHQTTNVFVYLSDGIVRAKSKYLAISHATGLPYTGDYDDIVVKTPNGWRIQKRIATLYFGGE